MEGELDVSPEIYTAPKHVLSVNHLVGGATARHVAQTRDIRVKHRLTNWERDAFEI